MRPTTHSEVAWLRRARSSMKAMHAVCVGGDAICAGTCPVKSSLPRFRMTGAHDWRGSARRGGDDRRGARTRRERERAGEGEESACVRDRLMMAWRDSCGSGRGALHTGGARLVASKRRLPSSAMPPSLPSLPRACSLAACTATSALHLAPACLPACRPACRPACLGSSHSASHSARAARCKQQPPTHAPHAHHTLAGRLPVPWLIRTVRGPPYSVRRGSLPAHRVLSPPLSRALRRPSWCTKTAQLTT